MFASLRGAALEPVCRDARRGSRAQASRGGTLNIAPAVAPDGAIAFASNKDGNSEIYVAGADGSGTRRLTISRGIDTSPAWSPSGQRIAFTSDRGGSAQVYVMDRDGGNARRLLSDFSYSDSPDWSPKGDKLAFVVRTGGGFDVCVANADGSNPRAIATGSSNENPHWSPDGRQLVFSSNRGGARGLYITDLRGTIVRRLEVRARSPIPPGPRVLAGGSVSGLNLDPNRPTTQGGSSR